MLVTRRAAQRLLIDQLAKAIEEGRVRGLNRDTCQRLLESERSKFFCGVREQVDADADRPDLGGRFEDPAGKAALLQRKPERQSANAGSDDDDVVHTPSRQALVCGNETRLISLPSIWRRCDLTAFDKAHAHPRGLTCKLTCEPLRAVP